MKIQIQIILQIILALTVVLIAGCAAPLPPPATDYTEYAKAKLALAAKPLFELECPPEGCIVKALRVHNPHAGSDIAAPAAPPRVESAAVGVAREFKETLFGLTPFAIAYTTGNTVAKIFKESSQANVALASRIQAPQANQTINVTGSNSAAAFGGAASSTGPVTTTTSTATTNTTSTSTATTNTNSGNTTTATNTNSGNTTTTTTPTTITCTNGTASGTATGQPTTGTGTGTATGTTTQNCR